MKRIFSGLALAVTLALVASPAFAAQFIKPEGNNGSVSLSSGQEYRNVYTAGGSVNVNTPVSGDLFAAGGTITVNSAIESDLFVAGGTLVINAQVGGDVRAGTGNLNVTAPIGGDLLVGGGTVVIDESSSIGGDLYGGTGSLELNAPVTGDVRVGGGDIYINSVISGDVSVKAEQGLTFGPEARVSGKITYRGPKEAVVQSGAQVSAIEFTRVENKDMGGFKTLGFVIGLAASFLAAWVAIRYSRSKVERVSNSIYDKPLANLGLGLVAVIVTPIIGVLLLVTFVGYYLAFIVFASYILLLLIACLMAVVFAGSVLWQWIKKTPTMEFSWRTALLGAVVMSVLELIPVVGWIILAALALMSMGAMVRMLKPHKTVDEVISTPEPTI
jgi:hypothetical protein